jgi:tetratricopeptide (TPR) repeat protein
MATLIGYALGNPADAAPLARKAMQLDPGSPNFVVVLAMLGEDLGDVREAMQLTEGALRRWPDSGPIHSLAAALHAGGGDWTAASQSARKALSIDPLDGFALYLLTMADLTIGDAGAARARYAKAYPDLLGPGPPRIDGSNYFDALGLAIILLRTGDDARARQLLDGSERAIRQMPRLGVFGYGITDAQIHALRGDKARALAALREAGNSGWRGPFWRFFRDVDPALASIRNELEFQAVFADIERDMARQRAELAKRPKDAPLDLGPPN